MEFRSIADMSRDVSNRLYLVPEDVDLVVGIPRSGMLAGSMVALALHVPLADVEGYIAGRTLRSGTTRRRPALGIRANEARHVLVVDDSIRTGESMEAARAELRAAYPDVRFTFCAIYGTKENAADVDFVFAFVPEPRIFEWNLMHHGRLSTSCVDIDGVLCLDPTSEENDDGERYASFILGASRRSRPSARVGALVTGRLEKYRSQTEDWLRRHNIEYDLLVMLDAPDARTRRERHSIAEFKGEFYRKGPYTLFVESESAQAHEIARISGKPVLSIEDLTIVKPGIGPLAAVQSARSAMREVPPLRRFKNFSQRVIGKERYLWVKALLKG